MCLSLACGRKNGAHACPHSAEPLNSGGRSIYEVMPKHLSQLYLGNRVPKPMPENEDLWEVKPGQATGFKP